MGCPTHAAEVVHAQGQEPGVGEAVHEQLGVARQAPDVGEVQHHVAVGPARRRHVRRHVEDGLHPAARAALVNRAEPAARAGGLGQISLVVAAAAGRGARRSSHDLSFL